MTLFQENARAKFLSQIGWFIALSVGAFAQSPDPGPAPAPPPVVVSNADLVAHKTKDGILFQVVAPGANTTVYLAGDFNGWANNNASVITDAQFKLDGPDASGVYSKTVKLDPGQHKFKFVVNGTWAAADWVKEKDADDNGIIYINAAGDVLLKNPVNSDWKPVLKDGKVTFQFYYPSAKSVYIAGDFNNWGNVKNDVVSDSSCAMTGPDANGVWQISLLVNPGSHPYKFVINGTVWEADPNADRLDSDGNSVTDAAVPKTPAQGT